jgi:hypothetical protein
VANVGVQAERGLCGEPAAGSEATEAGRKAIEARRGQSPKMNVSKPVRSAARLATPMDLMFLCVPFGAEPRALSRR